MQTFLSAEICECMYLYIYAIILFCCVIFVVVFVNFGMSTYSVNESSENIKLDLQFSNPSSTDISVQVTNRDISANSIGMCACMYIPLICTEYF